MSVGQVPWGEACLAMLAMMIVLIFVLIFYCVMPIYHSLQKKRERAEVTNSSDVFTNLEFRIYEFFLPTFIMISISTGKLRKKNMVWTNKKFFFFFNGSNWEKFVEKFVEQIGENIWWNRYFLYVHISNNGNNCILSKTGVWINYENEMIISVKNLIVFMYILVAKHRSIRWLSLKRIWIRTNISVDSSI